MYNINSFHYLLKIFWKYFLRYSEYKFISRLGIIRLNKDTKSKLEAVLATTFHARFEPSHQLL